MSERQIEQLPGLLSWGDELHQATTREEVRPWRRRIAVRWAGLRWRPRRR